ncbi:MAG: hypothetical protein D6711_02725 [Chloroflexi bacterium]|nr:MAG: hypothetical protein D6711_02725 [Chloroflexota bacterium]
MIKKTTPAHLASVDHHHGLAAAHHLPADHASAVAAVHHHPADHASAVAAATMTKKVTPVPLQVAAVMLIKKPMINHHLVHALVDFLIVAKKTIHSPMIKIKKMTPVPLATVAVHHHPVDHATALAAAATIKKVTPVSLQVAAVILIKKPMINHHLVHALGDF